MKRLECDLKQVSIFSLKEGTIVFETFIYNTYSHIPIYTQTYMCIMCVYNLPELCMMSSLSLGYSST